MSQVVPHEDALIAGASPTPLSDHQFGIPQQRSGHVSVEADSEQTQALNQVAYQRLVAQRRGAQ
jgi:hypothetical protein